MRPTQTSTSLINFFYRDLRKRNLVANSHPRLDVSNEDKILTPLPNVVYAGFDPTAESLHIGNLLVITSLIRSCLFGCRPIALIGGGTALIGDPSGRDTERSLLPVNYVKENSKNLTKQLVEIFENAKGIYSTGIELTIINNLEWYEKMTSLDFLRMASSFRVGTMLRQGPVKKRMVPGKGISFSEFSYSILQAYDWFILSKKFDCYFQIGGSDQLGNIEFGYEYIRLRSDFLSAGVCLPLIEDEGGRKLGKSTILENSQKGLWLDASLSSVYDFYQFFHQLHDDQAETFLRYFSLRPINEIDEVIIEHRKNLGKWIAQKHLAAELTQLVHGWSKMEKAIACSNIIFNGSLNEFEKLDSYDICRLFGDASTIRLSRNTVKTVSEFASLTRPAKIKETTINRIDIELESKNYFDKLIKSGAFKVNGKKLTNPDEIFQIDQFLIKEEFSLICWGKRKFSLVQWT